VLCLFAIKTLDTTNKVAERVDEVAQSIEEISNRRSATIDALHVDAIRQECVDRTEIHWMRTLTQALLLPPGSPEQDAAVQRLVPIEEELRTVEKRCYDENPLPNDPVVEDDASPPAIDGGPSTPSGGVTPNANASDGDDGRDGRDGRNGAPGEPGAPGLPGTSGTSGTSGRDGRDGVSVPGPVGPQGPAGQDGATGPQGPPGESVVGPEGPQGPQGFPGFDGMAPKSWTWTDANGDTFECSDPDGDLNYTCPMIAPAPVG
jgi:hypothetical protein